MKLAPIFITGAGAVTSVGFSLPTTFAAIDAGIDCFSETTFLDSVREPLIGAAIPNLIAPDVNQPLNHLDKATLSMMLAIEEATSQPDLEPATETLTLPSTLILLRPETNRASIISVEQLAAAMGSTQQQQLLATAVELPVAPLAFDEIHITRAGGTGALAEAIELAAELLHDEERPASVIVVGFDSWINIASIRFGLQSERLLESGRSSGFIPGEAVAAIKICPGKICSGNHCPGNHSPTPSFPAGTTTRLQISAIGTGEEQSDLDAEQPCFGIGLGSAMNQAFTDAGIEPSDLHYRVANLSGEEYFFNESAYAWSRVVRAPLDNRFIESVPASSIGEIGVAFGPLALGQLWLQAAALEQEEVEYEAPLHSLIQLSGPGPDRLVVVTRIAKPEHSDEISVAHETKFAT